MIELSGNFMKILFVVESYYPSLNGVANVVRYLAEGLAKKGYQVSVATRLLDCKSRNDVVNGVEIHRFDVNFNLLKLPSGEKKKFLDFVLNHNSDCVILECTECVTTDLVIPHLSKLKSKKILHVHGCSGLVRNSFFKKCDGFLHTVGHTYNKLKAFWYFNYWLKKYVTLFDKAIVISEADNGKPYLEKYLGNNVLVLGNAADEMFFQSEHIQHDVLKRLVGMKSSKYLLSCANYSVVKDQKTMIEQFYKARTEDCALVCIGSQANDYFGECQVLMQKMEEKYGHKEVFLLHHIDRTLFPSIVAESMIYLVTSRREQYSISIIEAMSQGIPFISTNVGNASILPGGLTIDHVSTMHKTIESLMKDKQLYQELSSKGKEFAYINCQKIIAVDKLDQIINL